ncbi:MAG: type II toxin-antitoxin system HicB family antitoxin [bacterium]
MKFPIELFKKNDTTYIASCPTLDLVTQGPTLERAILRLQEIINFYLQSADELGITIEDLCFSSPTPSFKNLN